MARVKGGRHILSATGATVTLLGDHNAYSSGQPQIADYTLTYGEQVGFDCSNLTPNENNLNWIIFPPDGSAFANKGAVATDASGNCQNPLRDVTLSTPLGSGNPDPPYSGVWAVALQQQNGNYEAVTYFVVTSEPQIQAYATGALTQPTNDFVAGQTIYAVANGLNPSDSYAIGFVQTSVPPIACVHAVPSTFAALPNCFSQSVANAGVQATSGTFEAAWDTSQAPVPAAGNYAIQLYDVTAHHLIATQQIAIQSTSAISWTLTPYQGTTNGSTGLNDFAYAFDGLLDQSVTGLVYHVTGLPGSGPYRLTVSDPNGAVLDSGVSADGKHVAAPATVTASGGVATSTQTSFALNPGKMTYVGPTATFQGSNTFLAQLYDPASQKVVAAKSFSLLAYAASFAWGAGQSVNAGPGGSCGGSLELLTVTNTAGATYGQTNADGIVGLKIDPDATGTVTVCGGDATTTDVNGNTWTITYTGGSAIVVNTASKPASLQPGQSLSFNIKLAAPSGKCSGPPCSLQTQILPLHGLAYSAVDSVTNGLLVGGKTNTSVPSDYAWAVTGPSPGVSITAPPPFNQMMYVAGTNGSVTTTNAYTLTITIQNNNPNGNANTINDVLFSFPSAFDFTAPGYTPKLVSMKTQAGATLGGWNLYTKNSGSNNVPLPNEFALGNGTNNSTSPNQPIQPGQTVIATITLPMPALSFPLQEIPAQGNFDGGCIQNTGTKCTYAATMLGQTGTNQNTIAGPTNVDSTELGIYSLNTTKMSGTFSPQTIGAGVATSTTFNFTNTPTSADPNPDYVDAITLTFPTGAQPTSITAPPGWTVTGSAPTFTVTLNACTPAPCQEVGAIAPGGSLALTANFPTTTTAGTYDGAGSDPPPVFWSVHGANGGTWTLASAAFEGRSTIIVSPVSANVQFAAAGGYPTGSAVTSGSEPTVGSDADPTNGNAFDYRITNNGSQTITDAVITVPVNNRAGAIGTDSGGQNWQIVGTPAAGSCTVTVTQVQLSPAKNGAITLSGCSIAPGASLDVVFDAKAPYQIGSEFDWPATVCANHATCATQSVQASPTWPTAEFLKIVVDARLSIIFSNGPPVVGNAPSLPNPGPGGSGPGGSTPATTCAACSIVSLGATPIISLGSFNGTATFNDLIDAAVTSDVVGPDAWNLYVSIDANPLNGSSGKELSMKIDTGVMVPLSGYTVPAAATAFFQPNATGAGVYPTALTGTLLGTYNGSAHRSPIDSIHSFQINNLGASGTQAVTLMWTLIPS